MQTTHKKFVPFFSLERQTKNINAQLKTAIANVVDSQQFVGGAFVENFEKKLASYLGVNHVISCNSGTDALWMALKALDIQKNDLVLTTPFSFIASSSEIANHGAHPVFIDIDERSFNVSARAMQLWLQENAIKKNGQTFHKNTNFPVVGIVAVDIFGQIADYDALNVIAKEWNLWIIADCAQSIGAELHDKKTGTFGTISAFSFYPTKNLGAFGDAGCCTTNDPILAEKLLQIRNHGRKSHYDYLDLGINSRLDGIQASVLTEKLAYIDSYNNARRAIAAQYNQKLAGLSFVKLPQNTTGHHVYHQYAIQVVDANGISLRNELEKHLLECGVPTRIFYPKSLPDINFLSLNPALKTDTPCSTNLVNTVLALPVWPELEQHEIDHVIESIKSFQYLAVNKNNQTQVQQTI